MLAGFSVFAGYHDGKDALYILDLKYEIIVIIVLDILFYILSKSAKEFRNYDSNLLVEYSDLGC